LLSKDARNIKDIIAKKNIFLDEKITLATVFLMQHFDSFVNASSPGGVMINANCLDVLKAMPDASVSLIIIDPPYGSQTHGQQSWDVAWKLTFWKQIIEQCFRVLVKCGHLVVFASGKTIFDIHTNITSSYKLKFKRDVSYYRMIWKHSSTDSGRVHSHTPRSQFEDIVVYFRTGEGKHMFDEGTLRPSYAFDAHVGRSNVLEFYKDDCRSKPQPTVQAFFGIRPSNSTFDYKPEQLLRALIRDFTSAGDIVVDLCMRHGATALASQYEWRKFIGIEIEEDSYARAVSRYNELFYPSTSPRITSDSEINVEQFDDVPNTTMPISTPKRRRIADSEDKSSYAGKIFHIGTARRYYELYIYKECPSIENDLYLVAHPDNLNELKVMSIKKAWVQSYVKEISNEEMSLLCNAKTSRYF
jgi:site-specific DNA-methyltransferase (adenine-specific)